MLFIFSLNLKGWDDGVWIISSSKLEFYILRVGPHIIKDNCDHLILKGPSSICCCLRGWLYIQFLNSTTIQLDTTLNHIFNWQYLSDNEIVTHIPKRPIKTALMK